MSTRALAPWMGLLLAACSALQPAPRTTAGTLAHAPPAPLASERCAGSSAGRSAEVANSLKILDVRGHNPTTDLTRLTVPAPSNASADAELEESVRSRLDPNCAAEGCIRKLYVLGSYTREAIEPYLEPCLTIDNGYTIAVIEYVTRGRTSLANVTIPYPRAAPEGGYHVVVNAHGTVGLDDACQTSDTIYGTGLAGLFGARGMIGIAPDYPGLGTPGALPYLVSNSEGAAVLDAMRAVRALAALLALPLSQRYAAVGLSEGGHAVLAAAAMHAAYAPELEIRAFGAAAPASAWFEHWQMGVASNGVHIPYHAMLLYAWSRYYGYDGPSLWSVGVGERIDSIMTRDCSFDFANRRDTYLRELGTSAEGIFAPDFLRAYRAGALPPSAAVLEQAFAENRIGPYEQTAPLAIWQGDADTTIPEPISAELVAALRAGGVSVDYHVVAHGTHFNTAFGFVAQNELATADSLAWLRERLDQPAAAPAP
jgi:hypothetical protein